MKIIKSVLMKDFQRLHIYRQVDDVRLCSDERIKP